MDEMKKLPIEALRAPKSIEERTLDALLRIEQTLDGLALIVAQREVAAHYPSVKKDKRR